MKRAKGNINITWASSSALISSLPWPERSHYWLLVTAAGWLMLVFLIKAALPFVCCKLTLGVCLKHLAIGASSHPTRLGIFQKEKVWGWQQGGGFACGTAAFKEDTFFSCLPTISSIHLCIVATNVLIQSDDRPSRLHRVSRHGTVLLLLLLNEELCEKEEVELWQEGLRSRMLTFYLLRQDSWGHGG